MGLELGIAQPVIADPQRHAVACEAMCRGMSTEQVEHAVQSVDILQQRLFYKQQRDELLAVCKSIHKLFASTANGWCPTILNDAIERIEASE